LVTIATPQELQAKGIYTFKTLENTLGDEADFIIDNFIVDKSISLLAGDSGIGKTPLCLTMALSIAGGLPFFDNKVKRPRRVLYCDAESSRHGFHKVVSQLSQHMGMSSVPETLNVWSPNWDANLMGTNYADTLFKHVQDATVQPEMVFIDPLRIFFPEADLKRDEALRILKQMRRIDCAWLIVHHTRKPQTDPDRRAPAIEDNPHIWFNEVAGQHALINHVDTRLGVEATPERPGSEMTLGGFVRMMGPVTPIYLNRDRDDEGEPIGYVRASSMDLLKDSYRECFYRLPEHELFTFRVAKDTLNKSDSAAANMLKRFAAIGAIIKVEGGYKRTQ
jgi:archaellum biogenesis ATPase FlaH